MNWIEKKPQVNEFLFENKTWYKYVEAKCLQILDLLSKIV